MQSGLPSRSLIIGCGYWGRRVAQAFTIAWPLSELHLYDESRAAIAQLCGEIEAKVLDVEDAEPFDIVFCTVPSSRHADVVANGTLQRFLCQARRVVFTKPAAHGGVRGLRGMEEPFMDHTYLAHPGFGLLMTSLADAPAWTVQATRWNEGGKRDSSHPLVDMCAHDVYLFRHLAGVCHEAITAKAIQRDGNSWALSLRSGPRRWRSDVRLFYGEKRREFLATIDPSESVRLREDVLGWVFERNGAVEASGPLTDMNSPLVRELLAIWRGESHVLDRYSTAAKDRALLDNTVTFMVMSEDSGWIPTTPISASHHVDHS